ncbi:MAG: transposase, partial [Pseudomonadales bacterium]|nr:transposase [Pseudomonadales bacterium]
MSGSTLEVADIFRAYGKAWRATQAGHLSLAQLKVMTAIEDCRTQVLGGHLLRCESCQHELISYNSCRNRHCPKCQASSAKRWLGARQVELLPVDYFHLVFTLPGPLSKLAYSNKKLMYGLLLQTAAETLLTIAADPKRLGAKLAVTFVLHTWGSALTHHPHVHGIVPGGGISLDGKRWVQCRSGYFLPVRVLSRLFRRLYLQKLCRLHAQLQFFGGHTALSEEESFRKWINPLKHIEWVVYAKKPFAGPEAVLAYLSRYTHRVAIANSRLVSANAETDRFRW